MKTTVTTMQPPQPAHGSLPPLCSAARQVHLQSCDFYKILIQMSGKVTLWLFKALFYSHLAALYRGPFPAWLPSPVNKQRGETASALPPAPQSPSVGSCGRRGHLGGSLGQGRPCSRAYQPGWKLGGQGNVYLGWGGYWSACPFCHAPRKAPRAETSSSSVALSCL